MIILSSSAFDVLLSFLVLGLCWNQLNASRQVILTCGPGEATQKGLPGSPGKRGPKGSIGAPGQKGKLCNISMTYCDSAKLKSEANKFKLFTVNRIIIT